MDEMQVQSGQMTIMIRSRFGGWREVTIEQARAWVRHELNHITTNIDKREYIQSRIQGITVDALMETF